MGVSIIIFAERMPGAYELLQKVKASGVVPMVICEIGRAHV